MTSTIREEHDPLRREWAILPGLSGAGARWTPGVTEIAVYRGIPFSPRVQLDTTDARVGRVAFWGGNHRALVRAVVLVDGREESLLLEDYTGYPWIRVPPDARLVEKTT